MKKSSLSLFLVAGLTMSAAGTASAVLASRLVSIALDRTPPDCVRRAKLRLAGSPNHRILLDHLDLAAKTLEQVPTRRVEITARDGERLVGHWYPCEDPHRIILAMHGWRSSWTKDFGAVAGYWHSHHCSVLFAEQRGQNESGGQYIGFGLLERYDCLDWANWLTQNTPDSLPIYLCGVSMGASTVLMAAGLDLPSRVRGIMADCGFTSLHDIWKHVAKNNLHISYALSDRLVDRMCRRRLRMGTREYSTLDAMSDCRVPVLFIHGTEDRFVPVEMTYANYRACAAPKQLFIVPGAEHGMSYFTDRTGYEAAAEHFWALHD